ncbi:MAG: FIST N-terminal domain-containing protein [Synechococcaceae cyanobacterium]|nr:FIST N-terminal domain-containing protein [Synechococcaceae cyanobacterium]
MTASAGGTQTSVPAASSDPLSQRWIRVGTSAAQEAERAVQEALAPILELGEPKLAIIFCSPAHDLAVISRLVKAAVGDSEVIGCSSAGELIRDHALSGGLLIWAMGGPGFAVTTGFGQGSTELGLRQAASEAARCIERLERREHTILFLLADGLCGDQMEVVRGAYEVCGARVPLMGACAGDDMALQSTSQIHEDRLLTHAVVAAAISSDAPMAIGIAHGWQPLTEPMLVTESHGTTLVSLDDRPALDVYLDLFEAPEEVRQDPARFFAFAHTRPVGIARRNRTEIRYVYGADYQKRTLTVFAEVPQGAMAYFMQGSCTSVLEATAEVCALAEQELQGLPARGFMLLECVARKSLLDQAGLLDASLRLPTVRDEVSVGGFYTYGEIARTEGAGGLHNQTVVALALA